MLGYAITNPDARMQCPICGHEMTDVTESWHTFAEAEGAEYLADYVTILYCQECRTVVGATESGVEWVMEGEGALEGSAATEE